nr:MAG TPA: hypothetical protein [Caudoviricetes sp.]
MTKYKIVGETLIDTVTNEVIKGVKILNAAEDLYIGDNVDFGIDVEVTLSDSAKVIDSKFISGSKAAITDNAVVINSEFQFDGDSVIRVARNAKVYNSTLRGDIKVLGATVVKDSRIKVPFLALRLDNFIENVEFISNSPEACHAFEKCYLKDCKIRYGNEPGDDNKYRGIHMIESILMGVENIGARFPDQVRNSLVIEKVYADGDQIQEGTMEVFKADLTEDEEKW